MCGLLEHPGEVQGAPGHDEEFGVSLHYPAGAAAGDSAIPHIFMSKMYVLMQMNPSQYVKTKAQQLFGVKTYSTQAAECEHCAMGEGKWLYSVTQH